MNQPCMRNQKSASVVVPRVGGEYFQPSAEVGRAATTEKRKVDHIMIDVQSFPSLGNTTPDGDPEPRKELFRSESMISGHCGVLLRYTSRSRRPVDAAKSSMAVHLTSTAFRSS